MPLDALRIQALLDDIDDEEVAALINSSQPWRLTRGEVLFRTGDEATGIFLIDSGKVKLTWRVCEGEPEDVLEVLGSGHVFGEVSVCDRCPRIGSAVAVTRCELRHVPTAEVERLISRHPSLARVLLVQMARRLRLSHGIRSIFSHSDVPGRVAFIILLLATRFGERRADGSIAVRHDITQSELASMVGASREAVNKALSDFAGRRWIDLGTKSLVVLNLPRLHIRAGTPGGKAGPVPRIGRRPEPETPAPTRHPWDHRTHPTRPGR
jgi:CRP-like cAMP-binding protein